MLGHDWKNDDWILASLRFMNRDGIGQNHLVKLRKVVTDFLSIKIDGQFSVFPVDLRYPPDVSVKDLLVVIVGDLHDLVAQFERPAAVQRDVVPLIPIMALRKKACASAARLEYNRIERE